MDSSAFLLHSQQPRDTKLAKEDLFSKRHAIPVDFDNEHHYQHKNRDLDDAETVLVNPIANPYYFQTGDLRPSNGGKR